MSKQTKKNNEATVAKKKGEQTKPNPISTVETEFIDFTVDIEAVNKEVQEFHDSLIGKPVADDADQKNNPFHGKEIAEDEILLTEDNVVSTFQHYMEEAKTSEQFRRAINNALKDKKKTKDIPQKTYDGLKATMTLLIPTLIEEQYDTTVIEDVLKQLCLGLEGKTPDLAKYLKLGESVEVITRENIGEHVLALVHDCELTPTMIKTVVVPFEDYFAGKKTSKGIDQVQYNELSRMLDALTEHIISQEMNVDMFDKFMGASLNAVLNTVNFVETDDEVFLLRDMKTSEELRAEDKKLLSTLVNKDATDVIAEVSKLINPPIKDTNQIIKFAIPRRKQLDTKEIYREVAELKYPC